MDSEMDLFLLASSTIQNSVETGFKKSKKNRSVYTIWVYIRTARDEENSRFKFYIYCIETPPYIISVSINMRGHFELKDEIIIDRIPNLI
jgi:hypothetical protein